MGPATKWWARVHRTGRPESAHNSGSRAFDLALFPAGVGESQRGNPLCPVLSPVSCRNKKQGRRRPLVKTSINSNMSPNSQEPQDNPCGSLVFLFTIPTHHTPAPALPVHGVPWRRHPRRSPGPPAAPARSPGATEETECAPGYGLSHGGWDRSRGPP